MTLIRTISERAIEVAAIAACAGVCVDNTENGSA